MSEKQIKNDFTESSHESGGISGLPSVAIVILNWNGCPFLEKFLPSVLASTYSNKKVIVADNASTDDSVAFLVNNYPQVSILQNSSNEGFARGYNTVLRQVKADYYVLLNSDVEVSPGWIEPVIDLMEADKTIAACQPKLKSWDNKEKFEYAGASGGPTWTPGPRRKGESHSPNESTSPRRRVPHRLRPTEPHSPE